MDFTCPTCKSENIQRLAIIYEHGISEIDAKTRGAGVGIGGGGLGIGAGSAKTTGTSQTAISKRAAPPKKLTYAKPLLAILAISIVLMLINQKNSNLEAFFGVAWFAASAAWIFSAFKYNSKIWTKLKAQWDNSYLCTRCNHIFKLGTD